MEGSRGGNDVLALHARPQATCPARAAPAPGRLQDRADATDAVVPLTGPLTWCVRRSWLAGLSPVAGEVGLAGQGGPTEDGGECCCLSSLAVPFWTGGNTDRMPLSSPAR